MTVSSLFTSRLGRLPLRAGSRASYATGVQLTRSCSTSTTGNCVQTTRPASHRRDAFELLVSSLAQHLTSLIFSES